MRRNDFRINGIFQTRCNTCKKVIIMHRDGVKWVPLDRPMPNEKQFSKHICPGWNAIQVIEE